MVCGSQLCDICVCAHMCVCVCVCVLEHIKIPCRNVKNVSYDLPDYFRIHMSLTTSRGLLDSPLCRRCAVREETSIHILCECEAFASLRHAYLGSFNPETEDIKSISLGAIWNFSIATGSHDLTWGTKGPLIKI